MGELGFFPHEDENEDGPSIAELILRCKDHPGQEFRVGVWEKATSAYKAAGRARKRFKTTEPNISIRSKRLFDPNGWAVLVKYTPPGMIRDEA